VRAVDWSFGEFHMRRRHNVTPKETNEATCDVDAVWFDPDPKSVSGRSVRVIGYSHSRKQVLTIILVHRDDGPGFYGANGWPANTSDRRRYERGE
jgi:hypothetical protein